MFLSCPLHGFLLIWPSHSICGIIFRMKGQSQGDMGRLNFLLCLLCSSVPISPIHFIWDTQTHNQCVGHRFQVKRSKVKITRVIWNFVVSTSRCPPNLTESLQMWHTYEAWGGRCVVLHFEDERSTVKVTLVFSNFGPICSVASSVFDRITFYVAYIQHMNGRCVAHHFQGERSRSHGPFEVFILYAMWLPPYLTKSRGMHTTHSGAMCRALF